MNKADAIAFLKKYQGRVIVNSSFSYARIVGLTPNLKYALVESISADDKFEIPPHAIGWLTPTSITESVEEWKFGTWLLI